MITGSDSIEISETHSFFFEPEVSSITLENRTWRLCSKKRLCALVSWQSKTLKTVTNLSLITDTHRDSANSDRARLSEKSNNPKFHNLFSYVRNTNNTSDSYWSRRHSVRDEPPSRWKTCRRLEQRILSRHCSMIAGRSEDDLWIRWRFEADCHTELFTPNRKWRRWILCRWRLTTVLFELQALDFENESHFFKHSLVDSNQGVRICGQKQCSICSAEWYRTDETGICEHEPSCEVRSCLQEWWNQNQVIEYVSLRNTAKENFWFHSWSVDGCKFFHSRSSSFWRWRMKKRNVRKANHDWSGSAYIKTARDFLTYADSLWVEWTGFFWIVCQHKFNCEQLQFNANRI